MTQIVIPAHVSDVLQSKALIFVATIGPKGEPQVSPVWFDWNGEHIRFSLTKMRQKYRNLQREPRVALSIVDQTDQFNRLEIRGKVVRIEDDLDRRFINSMSKKYTNQDIYTADQPGVERVIVLIDPEHITGLK